MIRRMPLAVLLGATLFSCATLPGVDFKKYEFPKDAYTDPPERHYEVLGPVRSRVNFPTLDPERDPKGLCQNYYNRAVQKLVEYAKKAGGDGVVDVKSVVFMMDGKSATFKDPECFDDGSEGQVLTRGLAVRWVKTPDELLQSRSQ